MTDLEQITRESRSSIELHRDAKGAYSWTIKAYSGSPFPIDDILDDIQIVDESLRLKYLTPKDDGLTPKLAASIEELRAKKEAAT